MSKQALQQLEHVGARTAAGVVEKAYTGRFRAQPTGAFAAPHTGRRSKARLLWLLAAMLGLFHNACFAAPTTLYQNNFEGQTGYAADNGWQYSSVYGYRNWAVIG